MKITRAILLLHLNYYILMLVDEADEVKNLINQF